MDGKSKDKKDIPKILYVKGTNIPIYKIIDILSWGGDVRTLLSEMPQISQPDLRASFANLSYFLQKFGVSDDVSVDISQFQKKLSVKTKHSEPQSKISTSELLVSKKVTDAIHVYVDGCSKGNPGKAGIGIVFIGTDGKVLEEISESIEDTTSNQAEYTALITALERAKSKGYNKLQVFSDSELMVNQIKGKYKIKSKDLQVLYEKVKSLLKDFVQFQIHRIDRKENKRADKLSYQAISES